MFMYSPVMYVILHVDDMSYGLACMPLVMASVSEVAWNPLPKLTPVNKEIFEYTVNYDVSDHTQVSVTIRLVRKIAQWCQRPPIVRGRYAIDLH